MCFTSAVCVSAGENTVEKGNISDISGHWAEETIKRWKDEGIINGYPDGTFKPNDSMSIVEFITIINRVYGYYEKEKDNYADVPKNSWYEKEAAIAKNNGYMDWLEENKLKPNDVIKRQQVSAIIALVMDLEGDGDKVSSYKDKDQVDSLYRPYIEALIEQQYLNGYEDKTIRPDAPITRAEVTKLLDGPVGMLISKNGNFGSSKTKVIDGNVTITNDNVTLTNMVINGDLIISKGVKRGNISLENVTVKGRILVDCGSLDTISMSNTKSKNFIIRSKSKLEFKAGTTIDELKIKKTASQTYINTNRKSEIKKVEANAELEIKGSAKIGTVNLKANNVNIEPKVTKINKSSGIKNSGVEVKTQSSGGSSSGGGSSGHSLSDDKEITGVTIGVFVDGKIAEIPKGTKVSALKASISYSPKASIEILEFSKGSAVKDQENTIVAKEMVVQITAENGSKKEYLTELIQLKAENVILESAYNRAGKTFNLSSGTTVEELLDEGKFTISEGAFLNIIKDGNKITTGTVTNQMLIKVTAENGDENLYSICVLTGVVGSDNNKIKSTEVGELTFDCIDNIPKGTKIGELMAGLTVEDESSSISIRTQIGGEYLYEAHGNNELTSDMIVEVTAQNGSKRTYLLQVIDSNPNLSNEKDLISTTIGTISETKIENIPIGTTVKQLLDALEISGVDKKIVDGASENEVEDTTVLTNSMIIQITAADDSKKEYNIVLLEIDTDSEK